MEEYSNSNKNEKSVSSDGIMVLDCDSTGRQIIHSRKKSSPNVEDGRVRISARNKYKKPQNYLADSNENNEKVVSKLDELDGFVSVSVTKSSTKSKNKGKKKNKKKKGKKKNKKTIGMKQSPEQFGEMTFHPNKKLGKEIEKIFSNMKIKNALSNDTDTVGIIIKLYGKYIQYNIDENKWYWYTGKYWEADNSYTVYNFVAKAVYEYTRRMNKNNSDKSAIKSNIAYGNNVAIKNLLEMMKTRCVCHFEDFDKCPFLINVNNGTVNAMSGKLQKHNPEDMITKFVDINYTSDAASVRYADFILEICDDDTNLAEYIQVMYGYALTGETREQCFFIEKGDGSNGKSTLNEVISEIVDKYTERVDSSLFQKSGNTSANAPTPEVAKLIKIRILFCSETDDNRLRESLIKEYTGGTRITARELYGKPFSFLPEFTIIFDGNILPTIKGVDHGIWRRIVVIPFNRKFDKDITLKDTLLKEKEFILKWLIDGACKYYQYGLPECKAVKKATKKYREEENTVESFVEHAIIEDSDSKCSAKDLYSAYEQYCINCCSSPVNIKTFKAAMVMKGHKNKRTNKGMFWTGICLRYDICK